MLLSSIASAQYTIETTDQIKQVASTIAYDMMVYYSGNKSGNTPGILPGPPPAGPYYWWEAGAMWGTLIDYWHLTGDSTYNDVVEQAMIFQVGEDKDYQPKNVTASLGNDDQGFWGMSAMLAAEMNFQNPDADKAQWLALAQAVWNTQAAPDRHDSTCGGGLRWQIPLSNNGYNYKNSIANGCFFNLGARLARYTSNDTYAQYAEETFDWMRTVGFIDENYNIYDGAHVETNCTDINKAQFSYNVGVWMQGAAFMYNYTGSDTWKQRTEALADNLLSVFFPNDIAYEIACETQGTCTTDMLSFKGYIHRWAAMSTQLAPFLKEKILPVLKTSAAAAVSTCTGGSYGRQCGFSWSNRAFDDTGVGQQMNVLGALSSLLIENAHAPLTNDTGGTSEGDYSAGTGSSSLNTQSVITTGDKAGAAILTILILGSAAGTFTWMSWGA